MRIFIANFGRDNFAWPDCLERSEVVTMQDERVHPFWRDDDRDGYIDFCVANLKTQKGAAPTRQTAGRWFNLGTIVTQSAGDLWLHQDGQYLWWTQTTDADPIVALGMDPGVSAGGFASIYYYRKPAKPWSNKDREGRLLTWRSLHPKCPDFLVTEATLQQLGERYAGYALALLEGRDLKAWHGLPDWSRRTSRREPVNVFTARQRTFALLARRAFETAANANGQTVERHTKIKNFEFKDVYDLEAHVAELRLRSPGRALRDQRHPVAGPRRRRPPALLFPRSDRQRGALRLRQSPDRLQVHQRLEVEPGR